MTNLMNNIDLFDLHNAGLHPASTFKYADLANRLRVDIEQGRVNSRVEGDYELFDYNSYGIFDAGWTETALVARGLVLDHKRKRVAAYAFPKFFNYGEVTYTLPSTDFTATEKLDGSLGICYWFEGAEGGYWRVNTRGSFDSDQAKWATKWLAKHPEVTKNFFKGNTYLFEVIYPENKIVVPYDFSGLVLLGAYHRDGWEFERYELEEVIEGTGLRLAEVHEFNSVEEMLEQAKELPFDKEGWVLSYPCGYKVKIKGDEYCRVHRLISNCTPLAVWNSYKSLDDFELLKKDLPEEFRVDLDNMVKIFNELFYKKLRGIQEWVEYTKAWADRDVGLASSNGEIPKSAAKWIFAARKTDFFAEIEVAGPLRDKFCLSFRPTNNHLEGYTPTSAMNRFESDAE